MGTESIDKPISRIIGSEQKINNADYKKDILPRLMEIKNNFRALSSLVENNSIVQAIIKKNIENANIKDSRKGQNNYSYDYSYNFWKKLKSIIEKELKSLLDGDVEDDARERKINEIQKIKEELTEKLITIKKNVEFVYLQYEEYVLYQILAKTKSRYLFLNDTEKEVIALDKLLVSIERFDSGKGASFVSYLSHNIYKEISSINKKRIVRRFSGIIREMQGANTITQKKIEQIFDFILYKYTQDGANYFMGELNSVPNELLEKIKNKVTKEFNLTKEVSSRIVDVIFAGVGNDLSLYFKDAHGEELFLLDVIDNGLLTRVGQDYKHTLKIASQITPEESIIKKEKKELLRNVLEKVANNNKESAIMKYRLLNGRKKTLQELADEFGVSRERIRQIERNIFKKARVKLEEMGYNFNDLH